MPVDHRSKPRGSHHPEAPHQSSPRRPHATPSVLVSERQTNALATARPARARPRSTDEHICPSGHCCPFVHEPTYMRRQKFPILPGVSDSKNSRRGIYTYRGRTLGPGPGSVVSIPTASSYDDASPSLTQRRTALPRLTVCGGWQDRHDRWTAGKYYAMGGRARRKKDCKTRGNTSITCGAGRGVRFATSAVNGLPLHRQTTPKEAPKKTLIIRRLLVRYGVQR
jgi:hypothetical protein